MKSYFIRGNTEELRNKLEDIGIELLSSCTNNNKYSYGLLISVGVGSNKLRLAQGLPYHSVETNGDFFVEEYIEKMKNSIIDCGTDEQLLFSYLKESGNS